jgi:hypothetical protein
MPGTDPTSRLGKAHQGNRPKPAKPTVSPTATAQDTDDFAQTVNHEIGSLFGGQAGRILAAVGPGSDQDADRIGGVRHRHIEGEVVPSDQGPGARHAEAGGGDATARADGLPSTS